ncbi:MAG: DNA primase [Bacteroidia bacterium]|nr:DNA primase [Bacteroidia bacterium]
MIPQKTVDLILDTAKIEEVVGDFVTLKRRGADFVACCPFHNEKTPSFHVNPSRGIYKCFGCGKGGSAVRFVMEYEHFSYVEALRYLADKYHIEVQEREETPEEIAAKHRNESLMIVSDFACKFFREALKTPEGRSHGYAYLRSRGIDDQTIERFSLGWAPSGKRSFTDAALAAGYKEEYLLEAGLSIRYDDGSLGDRFRERAMFPIHSVSGRVIAFSGRTLRQDGAIAKYVNSPETPIYTKSRSLYGIALAKSEIARRDRCLLAEGNVDVISMHRIGLANTVASCGTSLTPEQIRGIHKFTDNITVMYDGDKAGIHAALRAIPMILQEGMNVRLLLFPEGDDPDSFVRKHTLAEVEEFIGGNEMDFVQYMIRTGDEPRRDPLRRAALIAQVADCIACISDVVKHTVFIQEAAQLLEVDERTIRVRISETLARRRQEELKTEERRRRRIDAGLPPEPDGEPVQSSPATTPQTAPSETDSKVENSILAPAEADLLTFILRHGCDLLEFESDSDFYTGSESDKPTVADFIRAALEADGCSFANSALRKTYDAYMELYDKGLLQQDIIRALLNSPDGAVAEVTAEFSMERHLLTIKNFENSLTTTSSWLVTYVPKAILLYGEKRLENRLKELRAALAAAGGEDENILRDIRNIFNAQKKIKSRLGRQ